MSPPSTEIKEQFFDEFSELNELYQEVKKIVLLAEYENKKQKYLISSVNELRNSLDHIMRIMSEPDSLSKNFEKAKGHLYRAGYDGYEIIVVSKLTEIQDIKEQFSLDAITTAYPKYFSNVIPTIKKAKNELVAARANKKIDKDLIEKKTEEKHFQRFEQIAADLTSIVSEMELCIEGIKEIDTDNKNKAIIAKKEEQRLRRRNNLIIGILAPFILGIIIGTAILIIEYKIFVPTSETNQKQTEQTP